MGMSSPACCRLSLWWEVSNSLLPPPFAALFAEPFAEPVAEPEVDGAAEEGGGSGGCEQLSSEPSRYFMTSMKRDGLATTGAAAEAGDEVEEEKIEEGVGTGVGVVLVEAAEGVGVEDCRCLGRLTG